MILLALLLGSLLSPAEPAETGIAPGGSLDDEAGSLDREAETFCIAFAGDLMVHCTQATGASQAAQGKGYDFTVSFDRVRSILSTADLAVGNLETPLDGRLDGYCFPLFSAPVEYADALAAAGFDVLQVANNHALDRREEGLARTLEAVKSRGMRAVGAMPDDAELSLDLAGRRVAILAFTTFVNLRCRTAPCPALLHDRASWDKAATRVRELSGSHDVVVVLLHWMSEDRIRPTGAEKEQAQALVTAGAHAVVGTHSHVLGPAALVAREVATPAATNRYVRYSLGNFVHAMKRFPTRLGGIDKVCFGKSKAGGYGVTAVEFIPTMTARNGSKQRSFQAVPLVELEQACAGDPQTRRKAGVDCDEVRDYRKFLDKTPAFRP
jgi:poly-gamma-glutamate synthesis protein (capsule biosynthesis protein)